MCGGGEGDASSFAMEAVRKDLYEKMREMNQFLHYRPSLYTKRVIPSLSQDIIWSLAPFSLVYELLCKEEIYF